MKHLLVSVALVVAACGSSEQTVDALGHVDFTPDPSTTTSAMIGREGGELRMTSADGDVIVTVPPNAVIDPTPFAVTNASADVRNLQQLVVLEPDGASFLQPIQVRFVGKSGNWALGTDGAGDDVHRELEVVDGGDLVVDVQHFSTVGVGIEDVPDFLCVFVASNASKCTPEALAMSKIGRALDRAASEGRKISNDEAIDALIPWIDELEVEAQDALRDPKENFRRSYGDYTNLLAVLQYLRDDSGDPIVDPKSPPERQFNRRKFGVGARLEQAFVVYVLDIYRELERTQDIKTLAQLGPLFTAVKTAEFTVTAEKLVNDARIAYTVSDLSASIDPETAAGTVTAKVTYTIPTGAPQTAELEADIFVTGARLDGGGNTVTLTPAADGTITFPLTAEATEVTIRIVPHLRLDLANPLVFAAPVPTEKKLDGGRPQVVFTARVAGTATTGESITIHTLGEALLEARATIGGRPLVNHFIALEIVAGSGTLDSSGGSTNVAGKVTATYAPAGTPAGVIARVRATTEAAPGQPLVTEEVAVTIAQIDIVVTPGNQTIKRNGLLDFVATVTGIANTEVTWEASCGTIAQDGHYVAPATTTTCEITATSAADPSAFGKTTVVVADVLATVEIARHSSNNHPSGIFEKDSGAINCIAHQPNQSFFLVPADQELPHEMSSDNATTSVTSTATNTFDIALSASLAPRNQIFCPDGQLVPAQAELVTSHLLIVTPLVDGTLNFVLPGTIPSEFATTIVGVIQFATRAELDAGTQPITQVSGPIPMTANRPFAVIVATRVLGGDTGIDIDNHLTFRATFAP